MGEYLCEAKVYSCFFARARGLLSISFFLLIIGFKGIKLYNRLVLEN
jgi:hypothetical protein